ncbi:MAG TPA: Rieske 2Fe-2S domain-containing protein [Candidatus Limnocylindria bacterium]|nr:Rieske 2Fe-2S domain-containing protein [Candidatus Limnocylindria bacterium]
MSGRRLHRMLLGLYPPHWRRRYGDELLALLAERASGWPDVPNLLLGAVDAWTRSRPRPQPVAATPLLAASAPARAPMAVRAASHGVVALEPPEGVMSRRRFMRRMLLAGAALLSLEFVGGTINFLWPQLRSGLGAKFEVGTIADVLAEEPNFAKGWPYAFNPAHVFLVNVPAAIELALGRDVSMPNPAAGDLLALWRKCPHLGCLVPAPCDSVTRYQCRCHRSTYNILGEKMHEGPAERGLDRFAVSIDSNGVIVIDTGQITRGEPNRGPDALTFRDPHPWEATCAES